MEHLKQFWKHYVISAIVVPSAFAAGLEVAPKAPSNLDCKGTDCQVRVLVKDQGFQDAIYYTPDQWNAKTQTDIDTDAQSRFNKWQTFVDQQSQLTNDDATTTPNN